jgi:hypothetical protein
VSELDPNTLFARIAELARAQCDVEQIKASLHCEHQLDPAALSTFFELEVVSKWVDTCALAGQGELQQRMWQVAHELVDQPVGAGMAKWLAVNFLGHAKGDIAVEIRRLLAQLKADPARAAQLLERALPLLGGGDA